MADKFFIAPYDSESGLDTAVKPWLIPDRAFSVLNNAYVFRERVRKRFGSRYMGSNDGNGQFESRARVSLGTTDASGNITANVPLSGGTPIVTPAIGQAFSVGTQIFTVNSLTGIPVTLLISGTATLATWNITTGQVIINGADANTTLYYYPSLPIMGLLSFENTAIDNELTYAFDTKFAYGYTSGSGWNRLSGEATAGAATWNGNDSQFFWSCTYTGTNPFDQVFFVTNFNQNEPNYMRYFFNNQWQNFRPQVDSSNFLNSARILVPYKNHLLAFNTWEGASLVSQNNYQNRVRWSALGNPLATNAWRSDLPGNGNGLDAPTTEAIVTVSFVKDQLIVGFERSTWALNYTGNQVYPFQWYQINNEYGCEATFSIVEFDKISLYAGQVGYFACNGANVERIDQKIPDQIFKVHNLDAGIYRIYGIRDYFVEMVYWTFPNTAASSDFPYPNKVLVYNYRTGTWAINDDSITAFGYFQPQAGVTWDSTSVTWDSDITWDSGAATPRFQNVIAGNQEGYIFIIDPDETTNASVLQITDILAITANNNTITITSVNHNLSEGDYIYFAGITGTGNITLLNDTIFPVINDSANPITSNTFTILYEDSTGNILNGVYSGGGTMARVSNINIKTKEFNFYAKQGRNAVINKVDFMVDNTTYAQTQVNFYISTNLNSFANDGTTNYLIGTSTLEMFPYPTYYPYETGATRLWRSVYLWAEGECIAIELLMNDAQMRDVNVMYSGFTLHAMIIYSKPSSRLQ